MGSVSAGERVGLHIIGAFGDASRRLTSALFTDEYLASRFFIKSFSDVYPKERVLEDIEGVFSQAESRMRSGMNTKARKEMCNGITEKNIKYYQLDRDNPELDGELLEGVEQNDVIDISVPNRFHVPLLKQALFRGKNSLVEKPLASRPKEINELNEFMHTLDGYLENKCLIKDAEHYSHYPNVLYFIGNFRNYREGLDGFPSFGKVTGIELHIEEGEDFNCARNREIIHIPKSGGGVWLDMGVHALAFLRGIGAHINYRNIYAMPFKHFDTRIMGEEFGETAMHARMEICPDEFYKEGCMAEIIVGKAMGRDKKEFIINFEKGCAIINIKPKELRYISSGKFSMQKFEGEPFSNVLRDVWDCLFRSARPITGIDAAILNVGDVFIVYREAKKSRNASALGSLPDFEESEIIYDESGYSSGAGIAKKGKKLK